MNANTYRHIVERETQSIVHGFHEVRCSTEIEPFITKYFEKFRKQEFQIDDAIKSKVDDSIYIITEILYFLSLNTMEGREIEFRELEALESIFNIIYEWFDDVTQKEIFPEMSKLIFIKELLEQNRIRCDIRKDDINYDLIRQQMLIEDYEDLYTVIKKINEEWEDLVERGLVYYLFIDYFRKAMACEKYSKNMKRRGKEKYELFIKLLNGELKFKPIYRPIGYTIVEKEHSDRIIEENETYEEYFLKEKE